MGLLSKKTKTDVVFRKFTDGGETIALFPYIKENNAGNCLSYMHVGQHGGADYMGLLDITNPATENEYAPLFTELTILVGYNLNVIKRVNYEKRAKAFGYRQLTIPDWDSYKTYHHQQTGIMAKLEKRKYNEQTGCHKIDIFVNNQYACSTAQAKTCRDAKANYLAAQERMRPQLKGDKTPIDPLTVTAYFDRD